MTLPNDFDRSAGLARLEAQTTERAKYLVGSAMGRVARGCGVVPARARPLVGAILVAPARVVVAAGFLPALTRVVVIADFFPALARVVVIADFFPALARVVVRVGFFAALARVVRAAFLDPRTARTRLGLRPAARHGAPPGLLADATAPRAIHVLSPE